MQKKIRGLGCVTRALARTLFTQPSPGILLHLCIHIIVRSRTHFCLGHRERQPGDADRDVGKQVRLAGAEGGAPEIQLVREGQRAPRLVRDLVQGLWQHQPRRPETRGVHLGDGRQRESGRRERADLETVLRERGCSVVK